MWLRFRRFLQGIVSRMVPPPVSLTEKIQGSWTARAIFTACELDLADHLAGSSMGIEELARLSGTDREYLYRLMRALAGEGIFQELPGRVFRNTASSRALMEGEDSVKYLVLHQLSHTASSLFVQLSETVRTGEDAAGRMLGAGIFEHLKDHPEKVEVYQKGMDQSAGLISLALLSAYDFQGIRTLVDVGGGRGMLLASILEKYPTMKGILFDQPHVVPTAGTTVFNMDVRDRLTITGGDFFEDIPRGADACLMKNILHVLGDDECVTLLSKICDALPPGGRVIILETVVRPDNQPAPGKLLDLLMMIGTRGGRERTKEEFGAISRRAGLKIRRVIRTVAPFSVIEAVK